MTFFNITREFALGTTAMVFLVGGIFAFSEDAKKATHDGKVVSITPDKLVMSVNGGKEHTHNLTSEAKLSLDGKECKAEDLVPGTRIRVTTSSSDKTVAIRIEGIEKKPNFVRNRHDGKVVSMTTEKLVMYCPKSKEEQTCSLNEDVKITRDGKACRISDLKEGMWIRVTSDCNDSHAAIRIEALDQNADFAVNCHDGKVVSIVGNQLVMTNNKGQEMKTCILSDDVKVTCDGKNCKASDLKEGMRIRITSDKEAPQDTIRIEAIDRNPEFATS